jgi:hypothetical protein
MKKEENKEAPVTVNLAAWNRRFPNFGIWMQELRAESSKLRIPGPSMFPRFGIKQSELKAYYEEYMEPAAAAKILKSRMV